MTFNEFRDWVRSIKNPPDQATWWELKARLDAVASATAAKPAADPSSPPARSPQQAEIGPEVTSGFRFDDDVVDWPPPVAEEDWRGDGGVQVEAIRALRAQQRGKNAKQDA